MIPNAEEHGKFRSVVVIFPDSSTVLVWLDAISAEQSIEALPFDSRVGCGLHHLSIVTAQDFFEVAPRSFPPAPLLRFRPCK